jgi:hypothetical protein
MHAHTQHTHTHTHAHTHIHIQHSTAAHPNATQNTLKKPGPLDKSALIADSLKVINLVEHAAVSVQNFLLLSEVRLYTSSSLFTCFHISSNPFMPLLHLPTSLLHIVCTLSTPFGRPIYAILSP